MRAFRQIQASQFPSQTDCPLSRREKPRKSKGGAAPTEDYHAILVQRVARVALGPRHLYHQLRLASLQVVMGLFLTFLGLGLGGCSPGNQSGGLHGSIFSSGEVWSLPGTLRSTISLKFSGGFLSETGNSQLRSAGVSCCGVAAAAARIAASASTQIETAFATKASQEFSHGIKC
jgi:hypothetical protein